MIALFHIKQVNRNWKIPDDVPISIWFCIILRKCKIFEDLILFSYIFLWQSDLLASIDYYLQNFSHSI